MTIKSPRLGMAIPANKEQTTGPGVVVGGDGVSVCVRVGGTELAVIVAVLLAVGVLLGYAVTVGGMGCVVQPESRKANREKIDGRWALHPDFRHFSIEDHIYAVFK